MQRLLTSPGRRVHLPYAFRHLVLQREALGDVASVSMVVDEFVFWPLAAVTAENI